MRIESANKCIFSLEAPIHMIQRETTYLHLCLKLQGALTYMTSCTVRTSGRVFCPNKSKDLQSNKMDYSIT